LGSTSAAHAVYQRQPVDVRTGWQAIAACLRIRAPFFQQQGQRSGKMAALLPKCDHFLET
jgi:hypothetical protein